MPLFLIIGYVRWQIEMKKSYAYLFTYLRKEDDGKFNLQLFTVILLSCDANPKWEKLLFYISCHCFFFLLHDMFESSKTRKQTLCLFDGSKVPKPFWHLTKNKKMWCLWWMSQKISKENYHQIFFRLKSDKMGRISNATVILQYCNVCL